MEIFELKSARQNQHCCQNSRGFPFQVLCFDWNSGGNQIWTTENRSSFPGCQEILWQHFPLLGNFFFGENTAAESPSPWTQPQALGWKQQENNSCWTGHVSWTPCSLRSWGWQLCLLHCCCPTSWRTVRHYKDLGAIKYSVIHSFSKYLLFHTVYF